MIFTLFLLPNKKLVMIIPPVLIINAIHYAFIPMHHQIIFSCDSSVNLLECLTITILYATTGRGAVGSEGLVDTTFFLEVGTAYDD